MLKTIGSDARQGPTRRVAKVCIVDPRPSDYRRLLDDEPAGAPRIEFLSGGREALRAALAQQVDLWVVNVELPDMSGLEVCEMLRARTPSATVCVVADRYRPEDERRAWLRGATLFCAKPFERHWLADLAAEKFVKQAG